MAGHHHRRVEGGGVPLGSQRAAADPGHQRGPVQLRRESGATHPPVRRDPSLPPAATPGGTGPSGPPGPARPADRPAQPGPVVRSPAPDCRRPGAPRHRCGPALSGSRQLQGHQRPVRPSGRRLSAGGGGRSPPDPGPVRRHGRPPGRRRVRGAGRRPLRPGGGRPLAGRADPSGHAGAGAGGGATAAHLRQHRNRPRAPGYRSRGVPGSGRRGHVPGQARWTGPLRGLQPGDRRGQEAQQPAHPRTAGRPPAGPALDSLSAGLHRRGRDRGHGGPVAVATP